MARYFDDVYGVFEKTDFTEEFWNKFTRHVDERINKLEILELDWAAEIRRLKAITLEQIGVVFADANSILEGFASLGLVLTVRSDTEIVTGLGSKTITIVEADRSSVPSFGYVMLRSETSGDTMAGFIGSYDSGTGVLNFDATTSTGTGTNSDWVIGLSAAGGVDGFSAAGIEISEIEGFAPTTVQEAVQALADLNITAGSGVEITGSLADGWALGLNEATQTALSTPAGSAFKAVATGAINDKDIVVLNSDGTVSVVTENIVPPSLGAATVFEGAQTTYIASAYDAASGKIVIAYTDVGNSSYGKVVVGTVSGDTITFGSPVTFNSANTRDKAIVFDASTGQVVVAFHNNSGGGTGVARVGTVSGDSISFGAAATFNTGGTEHLSAASIGSGKVVLAYNDVGNSQYGTSIVGTISGTDISFGSEVVFQTSNTQNTAITYDSTNDRVVIAYVDIGGFGPNKAIVGTVSGTSISFGTAVSFGGTYMSTPRLIFDVTTEKLLLAMRDGGAGGKVFVGTVSGTTITFGTAVSFAAGAQELGMTGIGGGKFVITYKDGANSSYGTAMAGVIVGDSATFGVADVFESASTELTAPCFDTANGKVAIAYKDVANSNYGTGIVYTPEDITTDAQNHIGFADGAVADAEEATVKTISGVVTGLSGLTVGDRYHVGSDGTLANDNTDFGEIGMAIAADTLLITAVGARS